MDPLTPVLDDLAEDIDLLIPNVDDALARNGLVLVANALRNLAAAQVRPRAARVTTHPRAARLIDIGVSESHAESA